MWKKLLTHSNMYDTMHTEVTHTGHCIPNEEGGPRMNANMKCYENDRMMLDMLDMLRQLPPDKQELILTQIYGMATMALLIEVNSPA